MERETVIRSLLKAAAAQDEAGMARFFTPDAEILRPNTNERFDLSGYLRANCSSPGQWSGKVEKIAMDGSYSVAIVWSPEGAAARIVAFYQWRNGKIEQMVEYWGDVEPAPDRRQEMGKPMREAPQPALVGRCGFCCGVCPSFVSGECAGCGAAHRSGDCFTRDCTAERGLAFCTLCEAFPCEELLKREKATVLDKAWLRWKRRG